ncbi:MAG: helix-turn-helix domain-containing protein [Clostridia bacterium]|nr:helix-turn-helix domain-containing protein [Clostridia bacterium]
MDKQVIAERLKGLREGTGLSQAKLAKEIGISQPLIARYERAVNAPSFAALVAYADYFGVSCDYIIGRCDDPKGMPCARNAGSGEKNMDAGMQEAVEKCFDPDSPAYGKFKEAVLEVMAEKDK